MELNIGYVGNGRTAVETLFRELKTSSRYRIQQSIALVAQLRGGKPEHFKSSVESVPQIIAPNDLKVCKACNGTCFASMANI
jgi:hypothetical protein